jgi:hypothetical protein
MVGEFCLQNGIELVDICLERLNGFGYYPFDGQLAKLESGNQKSGGGIAV